MKVVGPGKGEVVVESSEKVRVVNEVRVVCEFSRGVFGKREEIKKVDDKGTEYTFGRIHRLR